ncbi:UDP-N-acetylmuramoyl-L-alanine--D-glutamate ligase [Candidatus Kaiserbacteria bacterium CG_4_9_14_3_um_filter_50_16]|uniref:UDP-N-acetylmuramoylalanine--D-glutamate ligase n=2 Tax=Candidatus Kaiseribacteriota TaxID=1752734 RepID=A0A2H0YZT4_9BACT|nr:MAG: UDP-N-acetylmuramoyl-L-alanine--D-glutamate ligase [Candidatus Kaiserbacteria bacterium CG08_land_8_20_14_0_20_50_21]PIU82227.1 MAG: UDP-N-acetylmuramoyl-L-alanine--D-glutamate ligase [Candidatus Kaiserbacteria bacterium CG06_land_8_20_14_3_00_49_31]PIW96365.1 MAG: UDP-N-acetylmuramoyl-L-alanine--D-glutamate ligase [Candidatus Kaiserbacteria bacterium CG_4_8_14_3_um_filter_50_23]PJA00157.1 MAG: UDP-N-acetylmuramoyl-L-alanine--D-glutamate ligase [Candidatus Kaiserbacteria bacterium CG_4_1
MDASSHFRAKKITVMGLGLLGRGVGDAKYLAEYGAELIVTDLKTREQLAESVTKLQKFPNIQFILGEHRLEDFKDRDFILKAAGIPLDSPYIAEAKKHNIPIRMSADLFAEISGIPIIGITGTRGKSTVAHMIYEILKTSDKPVLLGGNIRGVSNLSLLKEATPEYTAVLELDSWQLQGFGKAKISPHVAVFTTFYSDHLNYYHDDLDAYLADKANIFLNQGSEDTLIVGKQCAPIIIERYGDRIESKTFVIDELKLPDTWALRIPGIHNRYNAALALAVARVAGVADDVSHRALELFAGVPGRLELVREMNGVKFYNDTTATTPEATLAALAALDIAHTVLIMGGADKELDIAALISKLAEVKRVILLAGSGTDKIHKELSTARVHDTLSSAVADAFTHAHKGDSILFSPAFASFGMFENEFDRGDQFNALVQTL